MAASRSAEAERALRDSEERLRGVLDAMAEGFLLLDRDFTIVDLNREALLLDGRTRAELIGRSHWLAYPGSEDAPVGEAFRRVARDRRPAALEQEYHWPDGRFRWIDTRAYPTPDGGLAVFWRDVSERKATEAVLRETEIRLAALADAAPNPIWEIDGSGLVFANGRALDYLGASHADLVGSGWTRFVHPDDVEAFAAAYRSAFAEQRPYEQECRLRRADGQYRWHRNSGRPAANGRYVGSSTDVHDLMLLQDRQSFLVRELQHRVRNILTVVRSVFARTVAAGNAIEDMADHFRGRLDALARTQVVTQDGQREVDLENLVREELLSVGVSDGPDVVIAGPDIALPVTVAEMLGLAIHELTTNAVKFGALRGRGGRLRIEWAIEPADDGARLVITWLEQGVPAVGLKPARYGFGSELIEEALPYRLRAWTRLEYRGGGICCSISLPWPGAGT